jgi:lathosterol oxidase
MSDFLSMLPEGVLTILTRAEQIFLWEFGRYVVFAGVLFLLVCVLLKKPLASRKIREKTPRRPQMVREFKASTVTAFIFTLSGLGIMAMADAGIIHFYAGIDEYGWPYFIGSLALMIVLHDAWFYWTHRLMHRPGAMKYIHAEHHKSINPTPWTAYSFDPFEAAVHATFSPLFLMLFPMHGLATFLWMMHMLFRNVIGHSGYELFPRRWAVHPVLGLLTTVTHHDMHHANGRYNFGLYFSWWDRLMGTEHPDYLAKVTGNPDARRGGATPAEATKDAWIMQK